MKKLFSLMLALLMLLTPVLGVAEEMPNFELSTDALEAGRRIEGTVTFGNLPAVLLGEPTIDAAIADLVNALAIEYGMQGDEVNFALKLSDTDALTIGYGTSGEDTYLASNLLGGTVVIAQDELQVVIERLVDLFVMMGAIEEDQAAELKAQFPVIVETMEAQMKATLDAQLTEEDLLAMDYSAVLKAIEPILATVKTEAVTGQTKNSDPAATVMTITATPDDMKNVIKSLFQCIKDNPKLMTYMENQMGTNMAVLEGEEVPSMSEMLDELIAALDEEILFTKETVITIYLDEAGLPVLADATLYINGATKEVAVEDGTVTLPETSETPINFNYVRLTTAQGVTHTVNMIMEEVGATLNMIVGEDTLSGSFDMLDNEGAGFTMPFTVKEDLSEASIAFGFDDKQGTAMNITIDMAFQMSDTALAMDITGGVNVTDAGELAADMKLVVDADYAINGVDFEGGSVNDLYLNGQKIFTITEKEATVDPVASIMSGDVVRPAELSDTDFANWFVGIINGMYTWPNTLIQALPQSVLVLIMSMSNMGN